MFYFKPAIWHNVFNFLTRNSNSNCRSSIISNIIFRQFNIYGIQSFHSVRRILYLYRRLYNERSLKYLIFKLAKSRHTYYSLLVGIMFDWENEGISEQEFNKKLDKNVEYSQQEISQLGEWEIVYEEHNFCIYRQPYHNSNQYKYKVVGSFSDIPAWSFYKAQIDTIYRKQWDKYIIEYDIVDSQPRTNSEIIHWIMHFPYPMYDREYVYLRKHKFDKDRNMIVVIAKSVSYPTLPIDDKKYVRVSEYTSDLYIKPHDTIDKNGFKFILEYYDDPQALFSSSLYSWVTKSSIVDYIERLHQAAKDLAESETFDCNAVFGTTSSTDETDKRVSSSPSPETELSNAHLPLPVTSHNSNLSVSSSSDQKEDIRKSNPNNSLLERPAIKHSIGEGSRGLS